MATNILVGVDENESSTIAAQKAGALAGALDFTLYVLSAYGKNDYATFSSGTEKFVVSNARRAEDLLQQEVSKLRKDQPFLNVEQLVVEGKPAAALLAAATRLDAQLIVVGNRRVQGPGRFLGSVATEVASQASCDVYIAHTWPGRSGV